MRKNNLSYKAFFYSVSAACAILDDQLRYVDVNPAYLDTLARTRDELIGQYIWDAFPEDSKRQEKLTAIFRSALDGTPMVLDEIPFSIEDSNEGGDGRQEIWWKVHATPVPVEKGEPSLFCLLVQNITDEVRTRQLSEAVAGELQHRTGNLLNLVLIIARQTARNSPDISEFLGSYTARITSLSKTNNALTGGNWDGMDLKDLVRLELEAHSSRSDQNIITHGPELRLSATEAQAMSMALHELATNAAKHGALSAENGQLRLTWKYNESGFEFEWVESGATGLREPETLGFGSMILMKLLPSQLNGEAVREFRPDGFYYRISISTRNSW